MTDRQNLDEYLTGLPDSQQLLRAAMRRMPESGGAVLTGQLAGRADDSVTLAMDDRLVTIALDAVADIARAAGAGAAPDGNAQLVAVTVRPGSSVLVSQSVPATALAHAAAAASGGTMPFALSQPSRARDYMADAGEVDALHRERAGKAGTPMRDGDYTMIKSEPSPHATQTACQVTSTNGAVDTVVDFETDTPTDTSHDDIEV